MAPIVSVRNVSKRFRIPRLAHTTLKGRVLHPFDRSTHDEFDALDDVSFDVERGEFFGIVGRNGSGKSTLLKIITGIYRQDSGEVKIDGTLAAFIELGVGFNHDLSGRDNLFINGALMGMSKRYLQERYDSIVEFAGLERFMDMKLRNFSSGMQVRLAFSIAIEAGTDILITDEVLAVGDENFQRKCYDVFRERKEQGKTALFVSHNMASILLLCDRAIVLEEGKIVGEGSPSTVIKEYQHLNEDERRTESHVLRQLRKSSADATITSVLAQGEHADHRWTFEQGESVTLTMAVTFHAPANDPNPGIIITNTQGVDSVLFNAKWVGVKTGSFEAGSSAEFSFTFTNLLCDGSWGVNAVIINGGENGDVMGAAQADFPLVVTAPFEVPGIVDIPYTMDVTRTKARTPVATSE